MTVESGSLTSAEKNAVADESLSRAMSYVSDTWFPVNPSQLAKVKTSLSAGHYNENRDRLLNDVRQDYSLFMFCLRKLSELAMSSTDPLIEWVDPVAVFDQCSLEDFKKIFDSPAQFISQHRLDQISEFQTERMTEAMTSAQVAQSLAAKQGLNSDLTYSCALFRQLGLALISWNYPHVYSRTLSRLSSTPTLDIDTALSRRLGFSPTMLGIRIAQSWCIRPGVRFAMGDKSCETQLSSSERSLAHNLSKICETGEAFARAQNPERYPSAKTDWEHASAEIEKILGPSGFQALQNSLEKGLSTYLKSAPPTIAPVEETPLSVTSSDQNIDKKDEGLLSSQNIYLKHCPEEIRQKFLSLYSRIESKTVLKDNIDFLRKEIILPLGFESGCVYLMEPDLVTLMPRLPMGKTNLKELEPINFTSYNDREHPVCAAFRSNTPIAAIQTVAANNSQVFAATLGTTQKVGVLTLNPSAKLLADPLASPMAYFKAIRETMSACLNLQ